MANDLIPEKKKTNIVPVSPQDLSKIVPPDIVPIPFSREIYLYTSYIAGTTHIDNIDSLLVDIDNMILSFVREINEYDENAILIKDDKNNILGYVPKKDNPVFSKLLDAGKLLFGKVKEVEKKGQWNKVIIDIYLKD
ncbi:MAG: HIRAN domain-containing protein [Thomasclavelia sp.]|nr:HIRAN domain-containing protein [Thomasclavelia sp.]